jgi:hypothetical protein
MSIHGNQYLLPLFLRKDKNQPEIKGNDELALAFYLLIKELKKAKIISFAKLLWPLLSIQGVISTHIILDGIKIFSKEGKFSNPPRQPLIGHILRNVDNKSEIDLLNKIIEILTYKDIGATEVGTGEESEYQALSIDGLINPKHLQSLMKLIPYLEYLPIIDYAPLDTNITTETALDISEKYRDIIDMMKGNSLRWESQISLIEKELNKWMTDLTVKLKDAGLRYSSQINKVSSIIDDSQLKKQLELEHDKIDLWKGNEKKNIIENISVLFKTAERNLQEIIKKNRFFSQEDSLRSKVFEDLLDPFELHFNYLKEEGNKFLENIENLYKKYIEYKDQALNIDKKANEKLNEFEKQLTEKLQKRDIQLGEFQQEKQEVIKNLKNQQTEIEKSLRRIKEIIASKVNNCLKEANELIDWSIRDTQVELFSKPIQWIYMPFYAIFFEDESSKEEKMNVVFPGYIKDINSIYEDISESFKELKSFLIEKIENDMKIRSNFEFTLEHKNFLKDPSFKKKFQMGLSLLRNKALLNTQIESKIKEYLNITP